MIDTLAERLEREYGDDPERARRHARILGDMVEGGEVATRRDIQELRAEMQHEIGTLRSEMQHEIGTLRAGMQHMDGSLRSEMREIEQRVRSELHQEIANLRKDTAGLAWRMAGMLIAQTAVLVALLRFLPA